MDYRALPIKKYIMLAVIMLIIAIAIITLYYFFGYGTVSIDRKDAYLKIDNTVYDTNKDNIKLRPGSYNVYSASSVYSAQQTVTVYPFRQSQVTLAKTDYSKVIKDSLVSGETYKVSKVKLLNNKWLVGVSQDEENYNINILRFKDGQWINIETYTPTHKSPESTNNPSSRIPPYVYAYIKEISK